MKIGISALLFNLEKALEICEKNSNINHIELGIDNLEEIENLYKYKDKIKKMNLSLGIHLPMELNTCENINYIRNTWLEFIQKLDEGLKCFDMKYFNLHIGYVMSERLIKNRQKYLNISYEFLDTLTNKIHTNISIENVYSKYGDLSNIGNTLTDFEYIFSRIKNNKLWFCYDTGHNLLNEDEYIDKLANKIKVVHLSDNDGVSDIHTGIGKGILSIQSIKEVIQLNPKYLVLEIDFNHIEESLEKLNSIIKEV